MLNTSSDINFQFGLRRLSISVIRIRNHHKCDMYSFVIQVCGLFGQTLNQIRQDINIFNNFYTQHILRFIVEGVRYRKEEIMLLYKLANKCALSVKEIRTIVLIRIPYTLLNHHLRRNLLLYTFFSLDVVSISISISISVPGRPRASAKKIQRAA
ncbi:hypothetical protein TPHA_0M00110 [Tetrapisispora phaffii CBS 4417]|uniref:Uncharacterized protein n=1 Tax=Tetrapisispora phaffii (strain ATCC 24235 / CBS 4417 / NBRC 1672 / NRRL Y-8282 / UCD 70-5) TaxID=1071381 RepID=G8C0S8_TETPH|nr:hypothetical protein TPHA_0M00110 [Tetrapisispora phaffii CBS 4417]CCE65589.1 hypothetical protein TPHA_0M00110 [Tetrapisispora phaffii CBS 4417]